MVDWFFVVGKFRIENTGNPKSYIPVLPLLSAACLALVILTNLLFYREFASVGFWIYSSVCVCECCQCIADLWSTRLWIRVSPGCDKCIAMVCMKFTDVTYCTYHDMLEGKWRFVCVPNIQKPKLYRQKSFQCQLTRAQTKHFPYKQYFQIIANWDAFANLRDTILMFMHAFDYYFTWHLKPFKCVIFATFRQGNKLSFAS